MASKFFERRALRNQLKTYLETKGWVDLNWAEGFASISLDTIVLPYIAVNMDDLGTDELEMGRDPTINKTFSRRAQIDVYMEDEDRVGAITDDISDFLDLEALIIKDNNNAIIGSLISNTQTIMADQNLPSFDEPEVLRWSGVVACTYNAYYPNG
jgi:hypothetical protein